MPRTRIPLLPLAAVALGVAAAVGASPAAAQLPAGMDPAQVQHMLPSQIEVPAGETTTVDAGVPVSVGYASGGWSVSSSGSTVTVQAPNEPGTSASVPVSAGGYSTTVTLVAVGGGTALEEGAAAPEAVSGGDPAAPVSQPGPSHPPRTPAEPVDGQGARRLDFAGTIEGNVITVKVPLGQARQLMDLAGQSREGATLRYVDVNGNIIKGVARDVDAASRTLTLTYPEGETPDNPFLMEVVRDGAAEFIAVITSTNVPVEAAADPAGDYARYGAPAGGDAEAEAAEAQEGSNGGERNRVGPLVLGAVGLVALAGAVWMLARGRRRNDKGVSSGSTR